MSNLGPQYQNLSYGSLLQVPGGVTSTLQPVTDGNGNATGLSLSLTSVGISGLTANTASNIAGGAPGTVLYQSASGITAFTTIGSSGQILASNATGQPYWTSSVPQAGLAGSATAIAGGSPGAVPYQSAANITSFTSAGNAGQVLVSNGTSAPSWSDYAPYAFLSTASFNLQGGLPGNLVYQTNPGFTSFISSGTSGQYLQASGSSAPAWVTLTPGSIGALPRDGTLPMTGSLSLGGNRIVSLATPVYSDDAATKSYVDNTALGLNLKSSCVAATTANITLSGAQTIDGVSCVAGNRVLVKNQTAQENNGIYVVSTGAWGRSSDANTWISLVGATVFITGGTTLASTTWSSTISAGGTLGTTPVTFAQFAGSQTYSAGSGLSLVGNTFSLITPVSSASNISAGVAGDLLYQSAAGATSKLNISSTGFILVSDGSKPVWGLTAPYATSIQNGSAGAIPYQSGSSITSFLPIGTNNYVLTSNGTRPVWALAQSTNTPTALTFNSSGLGDAPGISFNGSAASTISYNTIGAAAVGGGNAFGTWPISISGSALNATSAVSITGNSGVTAGSYSNPTIVVNSQGLITSATAGSSGSGGVVTSTSSNTIPVLVGVYFQSVTFTTSVASTSAPFVVNQRVRAIYNSSNFIEGTITSFSGTTLVIYADNFAGIGTYSNWTIVPAEGGGRSGVLVAGGLNAPVNGGGQGGILVGGGTIAQPNGIILDCDGAANWLIHSPTKYQNAIESTLYSTACTGYATCVAGTNIINRNTGTSGDNNGFDQNFMLVGQRYTITSVGTSNFTLFGAPSNTVGTTFYANTSALYFTGTGRVTTFVGNNFYFLNKTFKVLSVVNSNQLTVTEVNGASVSFTGNYTEAFTYVYTTGTGICNTSWNGSYTTITFVSGDPFIPLFGSDPFVAVNNTDISSTVAFVNPGTYTVPSNLGNNSGVPFCWRTNINNQIVCYRAETLQGNYEEALNILGLASEQNGEGKCYTIESGGSWIYIYSNTSTSIGYGSKTFATTPTAGTVFAATQTVRVYYGVVAQYNTNYMDGVITSVSANSITVNVTSISGSASGANWNIIIRDMTTSRPLYIGAGEYGPGQKKYTIGVFPPNLTTGSTGYISLGGINGKESLRCYGPLTSTPYQSWLVARGDSGSSPTLTVEGSASDIFLNLSPKGIGGIRFGNQQANYVTAYSSSGYTPGFAAEGSGTDVDIVMAPKNAGGLNLYTQSNSQYIVKATGGATDVGIKFQTKGSGFVEFDNNVCLGYYTPTSDTPISGYIQIRYPGGGYIKIPTIA